MTTRVRQVTELAVKVTATSTVYIATTLMGACLRIVVARKLTTEYLNQNRETIERGLLVWLAEGSLTRIHLEVYRPGGAEAVERWRFCVLHDDAVDSVPTAPPAQQLADLCAVLRALPADAQYRVVVERSEGATTVPGWAPTKLLPMTQPEHAHIGAWGYEDARVALTYQKPGGPQ